MDKFGRGSTNLMSGSMQFNDNHNASQLLSQPFSQRSGLQNARAFTQQQHSMISTSQTQHQGGFSHRSNCCTPNTQVQQPALSGVFRPGSAPQQPPASSQQLHMPAGSQWSQQPATSMELSQPANTAASGSLLLRPKTVSLLRTAAGHQQLVSRPGSAPGLLSSGAAAAGSSWQPSLLAPDQQRQHQQQLPAPSFSEAIEGRQQYHSGGLQASQEMLGYHGSQGLGVNEQLLGSAGTESPSELLLGSQLPRGIAAVAAGKPSAKLQGLLQSLQDRRPKFSRPLQQQQPPAATLAAAATSSVDTRAADPGPSPAATPADGEGAAGNLAAAATAAAAAVAGSNLCSDEEAVVMEAAVVELTAAHGPAVNAALEQRITSLQDCCSTMSAIITRDIPSLLQHQLRADEQLQALAGSSTNNCAALETGLQGLAASVQGFMADFKAWQLQQEQQHAELLQLQRRSIADAAARAVVVSTAACQTSPQLIDGVNFMATPGPREQSAPQGGQLHGQGSCLQAAIASPAGKRSHSRQADPGCANTPAADDGQGKLHQNAGRCCPQPFAAALYSTPASAEPAETLTAAAAADDQDHPATCSRKQLSRQVQSKLLFPPRTTRSSTAATDMSAAATADASGRPADGAPAAEQLPDGSMQPVKPAGNPAQQQKPSSKGRKAASATKAAAAAKGSKTKSKKATGSTTAGGASSGGGGSGGQLTLQAAFRSAAHSSQPGGAAPSGAAAAAVEVDTLPPQAFAAAVQPAAASGVQRYFQRKGSSFSAARKEPEVRADVAEPMTAVDDGIRPAAAKLAAELPPVHHRTQQPSAAAAAGCAAAKRSAPGSQAAGRQRPAISEGHGAARAPAASRQRSAAAVSGGGGGGRFELMKRNRSGQLLGEQAAAAGRGGGSSFAAAAAAAASEGDGRPAVSSGAAAHTGSRRYASAGRLQQRPASAPRTAGAASFIRSASPASLLFSEALDSDSLDEVRQQAAGHVLPPEVDPAGGSGSMEVAGGQQEPDVAASAMLVDEEEIARQVAAHLARHRNKRRRAMQTASGQQQQPGKRPHT